MKLLTTVFFVVTINYFLFAQKELDEYMSIAAENNAGLKATFALYMASLEKIPQAKALPDPTITFQYFTRPLMLEMGKQRFNISASQMFTWFGQLESMKQVETAMAKSSYEKFINERNKIFFEVKSTYYELYLLHKTIQITEQNLALLQSLREIVKIRFEAGKNSFVDILRTDMEIAELNNELLSMKDMEHPIRAKFQQLLNANNFVTVHFPDTLWIDTLDNNKQILKDSLLMHNPQLKQMGYELAAWKNQLSVAHKMGLPSLMVGFNYMKMNKRDDKEFIDNGKDMWMFPEIGISIPLNKDKYDAMINETKYKQESVLQNKANMSNELNTELERKYAIYLDAVRRVALYEKLNELANNARKLLLADYSSAGTDFEEVLRMQEQELNYSIALEKARADLNTTVANINYLIGK